ncbi:MAG TPA: hypothetical protein VI033_03585 [Candidatus Nitrosopolaris sp.]
MSKTKRVTVGRGRGRLQTIGPTNVYCAVCHVEMFQVTTEYLCKTDPNGHPRIPVT